MPGIRTQDRKQRIKVHLTAGLALEDDDREWIGKTEKLGLRQLFLPDLLRNTVMATLVATLALVSYSTVGLWMPLCAAFLLIPVILLILTLVVWMYSPEHARKELDAISV